MSYNNGLVVMNSFSFFLVWEALYLPFDSKGQLWSLKQSWLYVPLNSFAAFKIFSLSLTFGISIMMCLGVGLFALMWDSLCLLDLHFYFLHQIRGDFFIIFSNRFPISCSFSSPSGTFMMQMLECLKLSQRLLTLS